MRGAALQNPTNALSHWSVSRYCGVEVHPHKHLVKQGIIDAVTCVLQSIEELRVVIHVDCIDIERAGCAQTAA